jgi:hypothetical protein
MAVHPGHEFLDVLCPAAKYPWLDVYSCCSAYRRMQYGHGRRVKKVIVKWRQEALKEQG